MDESFELRLYDKGGVLVVELVLSLFEANGITKECGNKKSTVYPYGS